MILFNILLFLISGFTTFIILPYIYKMLNESNCTAFNYRKKKIPVGMGLVFVIIQSINCYFTFIISKEVNDIILIYVISIIFIGLSGLLDDLIGDNQIKGFKGHIRSLINGKLTTGGLKASIGLILSILISLRVSVNIYDFLINIIIVSLFTNLLNLLDLRPGRASKFFITIAFILIIINPFHQLVSILFSALGIMLVYIPLDLKAGAMMGDIGSNSLGITLGMYIILISNYWVKILLLIMLMFLQVLSEFYSFSQFIEKHRILKKFDDFGR